MEERRHALTFFVPISVFVLFTGLVVLYFNLPDIAPSLVILVSGILIVLVTVSRMQFQRPGRFLGARFTRQTYLAGIILCCWLAYGLMWGLDKANHPKIAEWAQIVTCVSHWLVALIYSWFRTEIATGTNVEYVLRYMILRVLLLLVTTVLVAFVPLNLVHFATIFDALAHVSLFFLVWYTEMILGGLLHATITDEYLAVVGIAILRSEGILVVPIACFFVVNRFIDFVSHVDTTKHKELERQLMAFERKTLLAHVAMHNQQTASDGKVEVVVDKEEEERDTPAEEDQEEEGEGEGVDTTDLVFLSPGDLQRFTPKILQPPAVRPLAEKAREEEETTPEAATSEDTADEAKSEAKEAKEAKPKAQAIGRIEGDRRSRGAKGKKYPLLERRAHERQDRQDRRHGRLRRPAVLVAPPPPKAVQDGTTGENKPRLGGQSLMDSLRSKRQKG